MPTAPDDKALQRICEEVAKEHSVHPLARRLALDIDVYAKAVAQRYAATVGVGVPEDGWRPIATAPKDGDSILVANSAYHGGFQQVVFWDDEPRAPGFSWATSDGPNFHSTAFTHWRPLDAPPSA